MTVRDRTHITLTLLALSMAGIAYTTPNGAWAACLVSAFLGFVAGGLVSLDCAYRKLGELKQDLERLKDEIK